MTELLYDFGSGRSDPGNFPTKALKAAAAAASDFSALKSAIATALADI